MDSRLVLKNTNINWSKLAVIASSVLLSLALIMAHESPEKGYEPSLITSTPILIWILIYACFGIGIIVIFYNLVTWRAENNKGWLLGLLILLMARIALLYIPYTRGYVSWWDDHISYLGMTKDILSTGHVGASNFYPITHIIFSETTLLTGVQASIVENLSTAVMSLFFVICTYLLAGVMFKDVRYRVLATLIAGSTLLAGAYNVVSAPNGLSILMLPFLFYLYFIQSSEHRYSILLIIILFMYPFFHPLSSAVVIVALLILSIFKWFAPKSFSGDTGLGEKFISTAYFLFEIGVFTIWISSFAILRQGVEQAWFQITLGIGSGQLEQIGTSLDKLNIFGLDAVIFVFKLYGAQIVLTIIAIIGILFLLRRHRGETTDREIQNIAPLTIIFFLCGVLFLAFLFGLPGTQVGAGQQGRRFLGYYEILLPVFATIAYCQISKFNSLRKFTNIMILPVLCVTLTLSLASLYASSFIKQPNTQVTDMDMTGMKWFIQEKDQATYIKFISAYPFRYSDAILGYETTHTVRFDISHSRESISNHFGYTDFNTIGEQSSRNFYLTMTKYDRTVYTTIWKDVGRYVEKDFELLSYDTTMSNIYSNGETYFYYIESVHPG